MTRDSHICPHCSVEQAASKFQLYKGNPMGWCRSCRTVKEKERRASLGIEVKRFSRIDGNQKECLTCSVFKPLSEFVKNARGTGGVGAYCKPCLAKRPKNAKAQRAHTAAYRARHADRHRALHRLTQFKRREKIEAVSDGTVTDAVLKAVMAQTFCIYCKKLTPKNLRTLEHTIPLNRGGMHSASNLEMACFSCNATKRDRTPEEFEEYKSECQRRDPC